MGLELPPRIVGRFHRAPPRDGRVYIDFGTRIFWRDGVQMKLGPKQFRLAFGLACGTELNHRDCGRLLWGDDPEGGPLDIDGTFRQHLFYVKRAFLSLGLTIENRWGYGFRLAELRA